MDDETRPRSDRRPASSPRRHAPAGPLPSARRRSVRFAAAALVIAAMSAGHPAGADPLYDSDPPRTIDLRLEGFNGQPLSCHVEDPGEERPPLAEDEARRRCDWFLAGAAAASTPARWHTSEGWVEQRHQRFALEGHAVVELLADACRHYGAAQRWSNDFEHHSVKVLSSFGAILTYSDFVADSGGCGPPYGSEGWRAVDLRSGKPVTMFDVFRERDVLAALKQDRVVQRELAAGEIASAATVAELLRGVDETDFNPSAFAIAGWNPERRTAALRVGFHRGYCGMCPNSVSQLGVWVRPKPEHERAIAEAAAGNGVLFQ